MTDDNTPKTYNGYDAKELIELMLRPLSDKAYGDHPKSYLTSISADYTRERLTKIFGPYGLGWGLLWEPSNTKEWTSQTAAGKEKYNFAILQADFWYTFGDDFISFPVTGFDDKDNLGDAMKGARTSCISDGAKQLLFQLHIFKGETYQRPKISNERPPPATSQLPSIETETGKVITPTRAAGFETNGKSTTKPAEKEDAFPNKAARAFFEKMQKATAGKDVPPYWRNGFHFRSTMYKLDLNWLFLNSQDDIDSAAQELEQYASNRRDEEAAKNG